VVAGEAGSGSAGLHLAAGVVLLRPEEQAFAAMLGGWRNQQLARRLAFSTVEGRGAGHPRVRCPCRCVPVGVDATAGR
jgi:hypothetical protein